MNRLVLAISLLIVAGTTCQAQQSAAPVNRLPPSARPTTALQIPATADLPALIQDLELTSIADRTRWSLTFEFKDDNYKPRDAKEAAAEFELYIQQQDAATAKR